MTIMTIIYIYIYIYIDRDRKYGKSDIYIYIYIYIERERERDTGRDVDARKYLGNMSNVVESSHIWSLFCQLTEVKYEDLSAATTQVYSFTWQSMADRLPVLIFFLFFLFFHKSILLTHPHTDPIPCSERILISNSFFSASHKLSTSLLAQKTYTDAHI